MGVTSLEVMPLLHLFEHRLHLGVNEIDGLEWTDHHLELNDATFVVAPDHVYAIDLRPIDHGLEFQYGVVTLKDFANVVKRTLLTFLRRGGVAGEDLSGGAEVELGEFLAPLWGEDNRRQEDALIVQECVESAGKLARHVLVPLVNNGNDGVFVLITHSRTVQNRGS